MKFAVIFSSLLAGILGVASAGQEDARLAELAKFQGTWRIVYLVTAEGDVEQEAALLANGKLVFKGKEFRLLEGEKEGLKGTFTLDPSARPSTVDIHEGSET